MNCKSGAFFLLLFFIAGLPGFSQIEKPKKRPFNIGIYEGIGGINAYSFPSIDLNYKRTMLRLSPGYMALSAGITFDIRPVSPNFYNCFWIGSLYGSISSYEGFYLHKTVRKSENRPDYAEKISLLTGFKIYFGKRFYSIAQLGVQFVNTDAYTSVSRQYNGFDLVYRHPHKQEWLPAFEFGLGFNLFKTFPSSEDISN